MLKPRPLLLATALATGFSVTPAAALDGVVASVKPVHSLVSAVMEGVAAPQLLVKGAGSPHTYSLRPSEAAMLEQANVVFWVGPGLETFLEGPLETLAGGARVVELSETPGLTLLDMREGGAFEAHEHDEEDDHAHADHDDDGHGHHAEDGHDDHEEAHAEGHDDHGHEEAHAESHGDHGQEEAHAGEQAEEHHDDQAHGGKDMHIWLDPENARLMVRQIASTLAEADPDNAGAYKANAQTLEERLDALVVETGDTLADVTDRPFVVFHDAYHYFERRFGLQAAGSLTVSPDVIPGAHRLEEIHEKVAELDAACVFAEPQFEPKLIDVVTEGTSARAGVLDPLGAEIEDGPELYFTLIGNMGRSLADCLSGE